MVVEIDEETKDQVRQILSKMEKVVYLRVFLDKENCMYCSETQSLVEQLSELAPEGKLPVELYDVTEDKAPLEEYNVPMTPAILVDDGEHKNIRYFGIPAGYEFSALLEDILDLSRGSTQYLSPKAQEFIKSIDQPVHIKVFVTPTCPYCPRAVRQAHAAAFLNPNITGDMIEAMEFQELAAKYSVYGVPKIVINEKVQIEGAPPEPMFIQKLQEALS